ncbi:glycosyltransferase family protein [Hymenobacter rigui]|uniref:Glycosyl transferase family 28 C-terminal domain-containing protein n=1 Tax=Hymenobacter rigui TaxID=334424 RepID=A0A3R9MJU3_9BACT|nr:hypothetical protein [Hymenobacter rigui]RSK47568.1 hypothetical protein EI291_15030 [Hymenobacter rigui]
MKILTIPYIAGGLSHFVPAYVLQQRHIRKNAAVKNHFLVNRTIQRFLMMQGIPCAPIDYDYTVEDNTLTFENVSSMRASIIKMEKEAYDQVEPSLIIEDNSFLTPLIAEKNNIPRISIQRTGTFRSIDERYRNSNHIHSIQKGHYNEKSEFILDVSDVNLAASNCNDPDFNFLRQYVKPKAKIIPGIPTIERLPNNIKNRESYFYSGPLLVMDKPSSELTVRLDEFFKNNGQKPVVFITTGTIDRTPIENFIEFFAKRNYAIITTSDCIVNEEFKHAVFYNKLLPLNYICGISNLVIHQCGSGMYHYPIMNRVPSLTVGTLCYDREDIAQRLQELGVSGHIPHPDDNPNYWNIFLELVNKFEKKTLIDFSAVDKLRSEINETISNFQMERVIQYAVR